MKKILNILGTLAVVSFVCLWAAYLWVKVVCWTVENYCKCGGG